MAGVVPNAGGVNLLVDVFADPSWPPCYMAKKQLDVAMTRTKQKQPNGVSFKVRKSAMI